MDHGGKHASSRSTELPAFSVASVHHRHALQSGVGTLRSNRMCTKRWIRLLVSQAQYQDMRTSLAFLSACISLIRKTKLMKRGRSRVRKHRNHRCDAYATARSWPSMPRNHLWHALEEKHENIPVHVHRRRQTGTWVQRINADNTFDPAAVLQAQSRFILEASQPLSHRNKTSSKLTTWHGHNHRYLRITCGIRLKKNSKISQFRREGRDI